MERKYENVSILERLLAEGRFLCVSVRDSGEGRRGSREGSSVGLWGKS